MAIPGFRVIGNVTPEKLNPVPVMLAALTVTGDVPADVRVTGSASGVPTGSLPKLRLLLLKVRSGFATPVPLRFVVNRLPVAALLEMLVDPRNVPAVVGSKLT